MSEADRGKSISRDVAGFFRDLSLAPRVSGDQPLVPGRTRIVLRLRKPSALSLSFPMSSSLCFRLQPRRLTLSAECSLALNWFATRVLRAFPSGSRNSRFPRERREQAGIRISVGYSEIRVDKLGSAWLPTRRCSDNRDSSGRGESILTRRETLSSPDNGAITRDRVSPGRVARCTAASRSYQAQRSRRAPFA